MARNRVVVGAGRPARIPVEVATLLKELRSKPNRTPAENTALLNALVDVATLDVEK